MQHCNARLSRCRFAAAQDIKINSASASSLLTMPTSTARKAGRRTPTGNFWRSATSVTSASYARIEKFVGDKYQTVLEIAYAIVVTITSTRPATTEIQGEMVLVQFP
jgi:hypothetical protein